MPSTLPLSLASWSAPVGEATDQLAQRLRRAIESGELPAGTRLSPSRELALQLGIGRNVVVAAYARLLARGLVRAHGRHGTVVADVAGPEGDPGAQETAPAETGRARRAAALRIEARLRAPAAADTPAHLDWRLGQASTLALPLATWRQACREVGRRLPPAGYGDPRGELRLRQAIAQWLARERGLRADVSRIIVTQGASQAITQLSELLLRAGDACVVENPGYVRAAEVFAQQGAAVQPVPVDADGLDVAQAFGTRKPVLLHATPAHHYPLGMALSGERRRQLLQLARRHGTLVLENEYDHEFISGARRHAPLAASAPERVVLVSTFAKALSPSLRLGFVVAPPAIADRLAQAIDAQHRQVSWPVQLAVAWLLESGALDQHLRRVRRRLLGLRGLLDDALAQMGAGLRACGAPGAAGGQHVVLAGGSARASRALQASLRARGVQADRIDQFALAGTPAHGVLMSYGHLSPAQLRQATAVLAAAAAAAGHTGQ